MTLDRFIGFMLGSLVVFALLAYLLGLARANDIYAAYEQVTEFDQIGRYRDFVTNERYSSDGSYIRVTYAIDNAFYLASGPAEAIYDSASGELVAFSYDSGDDSDWSRWDAVEWLGAEEAEALSPKGH